MDKKQIDKPSKGFRLSGRLMVVATAALVSVLALTILIPFGCEAGSRPKAPIYNCPYTSESIKVDGLLDEAAWELAKTLSFVIPATLKETVSKAEGKLIWDDNYLYVGIKAYDKDVWSYLTKHDSTTCFEDVLEVFVKPSLTEDPYYNFEINAINTVYDGFNLKRYAGGEDHHRWHRWNCPNFKSAVHVKGTLNNHEDEDEYWQLEIAIPFASLPSLKGKVPAAGDKWTFHLSRYDYSIYLDDGVELSSTALLSKVDFHKAKDWSTLEFVK